MHLRRWTAVICALVFGIAAQTSAELPKRKAEIQPAKAVLVLPIASLPTPLEDKKSFKVGLNFKEIRAAFPGAKWQMTPVERFVDGGFARLLSAKEVVSLGGLPFDVIATRGPAAAAMALHFVSPSLAITKGECVTRVERFADSVADYAGASVSEAAWETQETYPFPSEPWSINLADWLLHDAPLDHTTLVRRPNLGDPFAQMELAMPSGESVAQPKGLAASKQNLRNRVMLTWWGRLTQNGAKYLVIGYFARDAAATAENPVSFSDPTETPGQCRLSFSASSIRAQTNIATNSVAPEIQRYSRRDLIASGRIADRLYALQVRADRDLTQDEADTYLCGIAVADNRLTDCRGETPEQPSPKGAPISYSPRTAPWFLSGLAVPGPPRDEDDFTPRFARVEFAFLPSDVAPNIDWDTGFAQSKSVEGKPSGVVTSRYFSIFSEDYPPVAIQNKIEADVKVDCTVLDDLSVFCGRVKAVIVSGAMPPDSTTTAESIFEKEVRRIIIRRMRANKALPKTRDGADARGIFYRIPINFRLPQ
jgi:hypothetical protein